MPLDATAPSPDTQNALTGIDADQYLKGALARLDTATSRMERSSAEADAMKPPALSLPPQPAQQKTSDPVQEFGQPAMWLAIFGGLLTRQPLLTAVRGMAESAKSTQQQDLALQKQQYDTWKTETDNAIKLAKFQQDAYRAAIDKAGKDASAAGASARVVATAFKDVPMLMAYEHGGLPEVEKMLKVRSGQAALLSERADKISDIRAAIEYDDQQHPDLDPKARAIRHLAIRAGHDPDDGPKTAAAAVERDAETIAAGRIATAEQQKGAPLTESEKAEIRVKTRDEVKQSPLSDEAADLVAQRVIAGDERATVGMARSTANITKVTNAIVRQAKQQGLSGQDIAIRIAEFQGTVAGERTLGTRAANMEVAANVVRQMVPVALSASTKVDRTQYPTLNSVVLAAQRGTGDENVVRFAQAANAIIYEYSKFLNPTGIPTDADKARATEILNTAWSQGQFAAALDQIANKEIPAGAAGVAETRGEFRTGLGTRTAPTPPAGGGPQEGQTGTSKSGKPIVYRNGQWVYQ